MKRHIYLSVVADWDHPFVTIMYPPSDGSLQQDDPPRHKAPIIPICCLEHDSESTDGPTEPLWDVVERQATDLPQPHDAGISIWTKISEDHVQLLVEAFPTKN